LEQIVSIGLQMHAPVNTNWFDQTPDSAFLRERQLIGVRNDPTYPRLIPISHATLWRLVKNKKFPAPVKLTKGVTAWRAKDVRRYLQKASEANLRKAK